MKSRNMLLAALAALALPLVALADEAATPATPATPATATSTEHHSSSAHHSASKVNLNSATKEQLAKLPGISEETADKIIGARPFKSTTELVSKNVVTQAEFDKLKGHITVKTSSSHSAETKSEPKKS